MRLGLALIACLVVITTLISCGRKEEPPPSQSVLEWSKRAAIAETAAESLKAEVAKLNKELAGTKEELRKSQAKSDEQKSWTWGAVLGAVLLFVIGIVIGSAARKRAASTENGRDA